MYMVSITKNPMTKNPMTKKLTCLLAATVISTAASHGAVLLNFAGGSATLSDGSVVNYTVSSTAGTLTGDPTLGLFDANEGAGDTPFSYTITFDTAVSLQVSATTGDNLGNSGDNEGVLFSSTGSSFVGTLSPDSTATFTTDAATGDLLFTRPNGANNSGSSLAFGDLIASGTTSVTISGNGPATNREAFTLEIADAVAVPEPSSTALLGLGGLALLARRKRI